MWGWQVQVEAEVTPSVIIVVSCSMTTVDSRTSSNGSASRASGSKQAARSMSCARRNNTARVIYWCDMNHISQCQHHAWPCHALVMMIMMTMNNNKNNKNNNVTTSSALRCLTVYKPIELYRVQHGGTYTAGALLISVWHSETATSYFNTTFTIRYRLTCNCCHGNISRVVL